VTRLQTHLHRVRRPHKEDYYFTATALHLFYQNCYYALNTTEQLFKLETQLFAIILRHSSEISPL